MDGYTTNYAERPETLRPEETPPDPWQLRCRALGKFAVPAVVGLLNVQLELWRYTPPLAATLVKALLYVLVLSGQQDLVRAGLRKKGFRPKGVVVDMRLFWSQTYAQTVLRTNPITHRWLFRYVYLPLGGRQHLLRNVLACYLLSGVWHEYLLAIASMQVSGLWFAYFALTGLIVCGERLLMPFRKALFRRLGEGTLGYRALKVAFPIGNLLLNVCMAHLIMMGFNQVIRFH
jgi:hypothetical protein